MEKRVFCKNCKHFKKYNMGANFLCNAEYKIDFTPVYWHKIYADPLEKNSNNDCKDFEPNLITRIFHRN